MARAKEEKPRSLGMLVLEDVSFHVRSSDTPRSIGYREAQVCHTEWPDGHAASGSQLRQQTGAR